MIRRAVFGMGAAILIFGIGSMVAGGAEPPKTTSEQDIVYTKAGSEELKLDLVRPADGDGPFPAVVVIHGGAWRQGNKADVRPILPQFAQRGYVAISPQYRFSPKVAFPAQVHDVKAAVRWLKTNAKKYKVDPDRIGASGFSAGGHLALMLGLTGPGDGLEGDVSAGAPDSRVKAVVNYFGPTDLAAKDIPEICKPWVNDFLGGTPQEKPETAAKASPLTFVSKDDAPVLTFQGTKDPLVPFNQAIKLAEAMSSAGVPGRVELLVGAEHGWAGAEMERTINDTFRFFDKQLKNGAASARP
jgi:acetyl esterase/lipase